MIFRIGIDFDNTLINYDRIIFSEAMVLGLIPEGARKTKRFIRDHIRRLPDGDRKWQKLQTRVYGSRIAEASLMEGVHHFLEMCKKHKVEITIISHKSEYYPLDASGTNFRKTALQWMEGQGFFSSSGFGLRRERVLFEDTRKEKVRRIQLSGCTHFIDDLSEVFCEEGFPTGVEKILFERERISSSGKSGVRVMPNWKEIGDYFFSSGSGSVKK